jgi:hypothetical protein
MVLLAAEPVAVATQLTATQHFAYSASMLEYLRASSLESVVQQLTGAPVWAAAAHVQGGVPQHEVYKRQPWRVGSPEVGDSGKGGPQIAVVECQDLRADGEDAHCVVKVVPKPQEGPRVDWERGGRDSSATSDCCH